ncbi:MAG TPA: YceI family protein [Verrucomicrobiae bacterium]|jgi:polyisoprenoid-binding protein YceI
MRDIAPFIRKRFQCIALAVGALLGASMLPAAAQSSYSSLPGASDIKIDGTSSLHDWEMEGTLIGGTLQFGAGVELDPAKTDVAGAQGNKVSAKSHIIVPITSIHSKADHMPDTMDRLMQEALKASDNPRIELTMTDLMFKGPHEAGKPFNFDVTGNLSIAGKSNHVTFPVTMDCSQPDKIVVNGTVPIKMTDYGVTPPAPNFGLGMMKVGEDVKIIFQWTVHKRK